MPNWAYSGTPVPIHRQTVFAIDVGQHHARAGHWFEIARRPGEAMHRISVAI